MKEIRLALHKTREFNKDSFSTIWLDEARTLKAIIGRLQTTNEQAVQTVVFSPESWTWKRAKAWLSQHKDSILEGSRMTEKVQLSETVEVMETPESVIFEQGKNAVINHVKILGMVSANNRRYTKKALESSVSKYEGIKVNLNHPDASASQPRKFQDRIGTLREVKFVEGEGLYGNLHLNPKHPWTETMIGWAETDPSAVGLSHNATGRGRKEKGTFIVEEIPSVRHVDIVSDPATTQGLFEHTEEDSSESNEETETKEGSTVELKDATLEQLKKDRPDLLEAIGKESEDKDAVSTLQEENKELKKELDEAKVKKALAEHKELCEKLIKEAKLPEKAISDTFKEQLFEAKDKEAVQALIDDRKKLVGASAPKSRETTLEGKSGEPMDAKAFASRLKG